MEERGYTNRVLTFTERVKYAEADERGWPNGVCDETCHGTRSSRTRTLTMDIEKGRDSTYVVRRPKDIFAMNVNELF